MLTCSWVRDICSSNLYTFTLPGTMPPGNPSPLTTNLQYIQHVHLERYTTRTWAYNWSMEILRRSKYTHQKRKLYIFIMVFIIDEKTNTNISQCREWNSIVCKSAKLYQLESFLQNNQRKSHDLSELDLDRHTTRLWTSMWVLTTGQCRCSEDLSTLMNQLVSVDVQKILVH